MQEVRVMLVAYSESQVMTHERRMSMCTLYKLFIGKVLQRILRLVSTRVRGLTTLQKYVQWIVKNCITNGNLPCCIRS